jgi:hypothetical protein
MIAYLRSGTIGRNRFKSPPVRHTSKANTNGLSKRVPFHKVRDHILTWFANKKRSLWNFFHCKVEREFLNGNVTVESARVSEEPDLKID